VKRVALGGGALLAIGLGVLLTFQSCRDTAPGPKIPSDVARRIDSMSITRPAFDSTQAAGRVTIIRDTSAALVARRAAARSDSMAKASERRADSLADVAREAKASDSAAVGWMLAYEARTEEASALRISRDSARAAYASEHRALVTLGGLYAADTLRRSETDRINSDLRKAIDRLEKPCRVVGPIPCPNRIVSALLGAAAGAGAARGSK
jgi:hypothetical protein